MPQETTMICCTCEISGSPSNVRCEKSILNARNCNQNEKVRDFRKDSNFIIFTSCKTEVFFKDTEILFITTV